MFGISRLSAILLATWDFWDSSSQYGFVTSSNWPDIAGLVSVETRLLLFILLKISRVSSSTLHLVLSIWASFPDLRRNTLFFGYWWWVMIHKVTFIAIINIRLRRSKRYRGFRALAMNVMSSMVCPWGPLHLSLIGDYLVEYLPSFLTSSL